MVDITKYVIDLKEKDLPLEKIGIRVNTLDENKSEKRSR